MMTTNSNTAYDDFLGVIDNLKLDFDRAYSDVSTDIEPVLFEVLARRYGLSARAVRDAWRGYLERRRLDRPMLGPINPDFESAIAPSTQKLEVISKS
jgi:hypothetical protein